MDKIEQTTKCIVVDPSKAAGDLMRNEVQNTKGCFMPTEIPKPLPLPNLELGEIKHQGGIINNPYPDNAIPIADEQLRKSSVQLDYKDGTSFQLGTNTQTLELPNHQRLQIGQSGRLSILDKFGERVPVTQREDPSGDIMPMVTRTDFANGSRMSEDAGIGIISMGNGFRVYVDSKGFRAVDNEQGHRLALQGEFDFRGFK